MATKRYYATRDLKNPGYGTRMLRAGDPLDLDGPKARLYLALGAVTETKPKAPPKIDETLRSEVEMAPTEKPAPKPARKRRKK